MNRFSGVLLGLAVILLAFSSIIVQSQIADINRRLETVEHK